MSSNINPYNIDGTFPIAGQDNSSQGFRDNFTNIKNNFLFAQNEINDLQTKAILTSALEGQTINNDMAGGVIRRPQLAAWTQSLLDLNVISNSATLDFSLANFQKITTADSIAINFINWPTSSGVGALGYGSMRVWFVVTDVSHTITLDPKVTIGIDDIAGYNSDTGAIQFDVPGNYVFDFSSIDGGNNFLVFDLTRNRVQFRDPSFYFNEAVSPTLLIGFQDALPLAISLATGNDTMELRGSQSNYSGVLEHGNDVGAGVFSEAYPQLNGNVHVPGYSVATSRAYIDAQGQPVFDETALVQPNDFIGYFNFIAPTLNPVALPGVDVGICDFATIRGFVNGVSPYSPGGNLWIGTKPDNGVVTTAVTIENDQSVHFYGATTTAGNATVTGNATIHGTLKTDAGVVNGGTYKVAFVTSGGSSFTANSAVSTVIIDSTSSATVANGTIILPSNPVDRQTFRISAVAPITTANVYSPTGTHAVKYVPTNAFASGNVAIQLTYMASDTTWFRS